MKLGSTGIHEELCTGTQVSLSKISEKQPSMRQPVDNGIEYTVVKWQVVMEVPGLMKLLSQTGNAGHEVHRVQTALQARISP